MKINIRLNIEKRYVFLIVGVVLVIGGIILGYAFNYQGSAPNPGHLGDQVLVSINGTESNLQEAIDSGAIVNVLGSVYNVTNSHCPNLGILSSSPTCSFTENGVSGCTGFPRVAQCDSNKYSSSGCVLSSCSCPNFDFTPKATYTCNNVLVGVVSAPNTYPVSNGDGSYRPQPMPGLSCYSASTEVTNGGEFYSLNCGSGYTMTGGSILCDNGGANSYVLQPGAIEFETNSVSGMCYGTRNGDNVQIMFIRCCKVG